MHLIWLIRPPLGVFDKKENEKMRDTQSKRASPTTPPSHVCNCSGLNWLCAVSVAAVHVTGGSAFRAALTVCPTKLNSDDELSANVTCAAIIKRHLTQLRVEKLRAINSRPSFGYFLIRPSSAHFEFGFKLRAKGGKAINYINRGCSMSNFTGDLKNLKITRLMPYLLCIYIRVWKNPSFIDRYFFQTFHPKPQTSNTRGFIEKA